MYEIYSEAHPPSSLSEQWCGNGKENTVELHLFGDEGKLDFKMKIQCTQDLGGSDSSTKHSVEPFVWRIMNRNAEAP